MDKDRKKEVIRKVAENVKYLCYLQSRNIGDMEKELDLPVGYFSRRSSGKSEDLSYVALVELSELFGVKIDELLSIDYGNIYRKEKLQRELLELEERKKAIMEELDERKREIMEEIGETDGC